MAQFEDNKGRIWVLEITHGAYRRLKRETKLDLDLVGTEALDLVEVVYGEESGLVDVMACLLNEQVRESGLSVEEFHGRFPPEVVDRAGDALVEAIRDFFHWRLARKTVLARRTRSKKPEPRSTSSASSAAELSA